MRHSAFRQICDSSATSHSSGFSGVGLRISALFRIPDLGLRASFGLRTSDFGLASLLIIFPALAFAPTALAQQPNSPRIGYAYPAGGRQGSTFQVKLGGQFLDGATNVFVSGAGVRAAVLEHVKPLTPQQFNSLRDKLKELQEKRQAAYRSRWRHNGAGGAPGSTNGVWTAEDEKLFAELRKRIATFVRRPANPAIAETVTLQVTLAPDAEPGERELRLKTQQGLSNPLVFCVGQLPEFRKRQPVADDSLGALRALRNNNEQKATPPTETTVTLPAIVNGQILPGGVDRYRFSARKGQRLVVVVSARALIPYLPDAVPGWFQAAVTLYDAKGNELAYDDHYRFHPDPVLYCEVPKDGEYMAEIHDSVYRGREDFVYRIAIGELPFVTSMFPLGGPAGAQTSVESERLEPGGDEPGGGQQGQGAGPLFRVRTRRRPGFQPGAVRG